GSTYNEKGTSDASVPLGWGTMKRSARRSVVDPWWLSGGQERNGAPPDAGAPGAPGENAIDEPRVPSRDGRPGDGRLGDGRLGDGRLGDGQPGDGRLGDGQLG